MYCTNCGAQRAANVTTCASCGAAIRTFPVMPPVPNYLVQSILTTLCCCLPFGVVAIIYSAQVNTKLSVGDIEGAMASSRSARTWAWVSFICGALVSLAYAGFVAMQAAGSN